MGVYNGCHTVTTRHSESWFVFVRPFGEGTNHRKTDYAYDDLLTLSRKPWPLLLQQIRKKDMMQPNMPSLSKLLLAKFYAKDATTSTESWLYYQL